MMFRIGELSKLTGVHIETIRYYERIGLAPEPSRSANGYRRYGDDSVKRLNFVRRGRELGFTLALQAADRNRGSSAKPRPR